MITEHLNQRAYVHVLVVWLEPHTVILFSFPSLNLGILDPNCLELCLQLFLLVTSLGPCSLAMCYHGIECPMPTVLVLHRMECDGE